MPDLVRWAGSALAPGDAATQLRDLVCARFGVRHCVFTSTGRAGMTLLLRALARLGSPGRDEVIVPSYTCYSVAASIVKAGLKPRLVDIVPHTLDYDAARLDEANWSRAVAVIATNLYGIPNDLPALAARARRHGVFLVDDAAQAMGAAVGGRRSGAWGDAGLFSFDKGKNVSAIDGGIVTTTSAAIAAALDAETAQLQPPGAAASGAHVVKALAYAVLLHPTLYAIPTRIPQLALGKTVFTTDFPLERADPTLLSLALVMMRRLDAFTTARRANAALCPGRARARRRHHDDRPAVRRDGRLPPVSGALPRRGRPRSRDRGPDPGGHRRHGLLSRVAGRRRRARRRVGRAPSPAEGGRAVARRIMTLPTHPFVTRADIARAVAIIERGISTACAA
ncbi:MAG: DegT/DnrJ/EryC1/StrS family aminotransferase [Vicinamibacterales bacterium]